MARPWEKYAAPAAQQPLEGDPVAQEIIAGPKPWEKYAPKAKVAPVEKNINKGEAALQGFGQAASFGYLPNLQAAAEPLTDKVFGLLSGNKVEDDRSYVERRDANVVKDKELSNSGAYNIGQIAGSLATPVPGSGLIKGAGWGAKLGKAALGGAITGAAYNPGEIEGEMSGLQLGERAKSGALGAGTGIAAQGLLSAGSGAAKAWSGKGAKLKEVADMLSLDALGTKKKYAKMLIENDKVEDVAKFARDKNIITAGETFDSAYKKAKAMKDQVGKEIGDTYKQIAEDAANPKVIEKANPKHLFELEEAMVPPESLAKKFLTEESEALRGTSGSKQIIGKLQGEMENLAEVSNDIPSLLKYRRSLDKTIKSWGIESPGSEASLKKLRAYVKNDIDKRIGALDKVVGSDKVNKLKEINKNFGLISDIEMILQDKAESEIANRGLGLIPSMIGIGGGIVGAGSAIAQGQDASDVATRGLGGLAAGYAFKKGRDYLPAIGAKTLGAASGLIEKDPTGKLAGKAAGLLDKVDPAQLGGLLERVRK